MPDIEQVKIAKQAKPLAGADVQRQAAHPPTSGAISPSNGAGLGRGQTQPDRDHIEVIRPMRATTNVLTMEAWDHSLKRAVMVRTLTPQARQSVTISDEFWRQARNQARLRDDHVLPVLFVDKEANWVVTEYCSKSLQDEIEPSGMAADRLQRILIQALEGLAYLHDQGQLHGGIHPGVILIGPDDSVKLDCPSGREIGAELTLQQSLEKYAAPESLDENKYGAVSSAVDIYALGVTALELLSGKKFADFFRGYDLDFSDGGEAWLRWHLSAEARVPNVNRVLPKVPLKLASVIDRMLEKRVSQRLSSARAALSALANNQLETTHALPITTTLSTPLATTNSPVQSIEPIAVSSLARGSTVFAIGNTNQQSSGVKAWAKGLLTENNSNHLAAAMILLAAFIAGLSLVGSSSPKSEAPVPIRVVNKSNEEESSEPVPLPPPPKPPVVTAVAVPPKAPAPVVKPTVRMPPLPTPDGHLYVSVKPNGAWVRLKGKLQHNEFAGPLAAGTYVIEAGKWDCVPQQRTVVIRSGETASLLFELEQRPTTIPYEPVLCVSTDKADEADQFVTHLLNDFWTSRTRRGSLIGVENQLREMQPVCQDPRVPHAIALVALGENNNAKRASIWYERATQHAPVFYSWPYKGLVKCLLAQGKREEAIRQSYDFAYRAQTFVARHPGNPKAGLFLDDTACFVGRVIGLVEALSPQPDETSLISRDLASHLSESAMSVLCDAKSETLARYRETLGDNVTDSESTVWQFLGDSVARERRSLLDSIGCRSQQGFRVRVVVGEKSALANQLVIPNDGKASFAATTDFLITRRAIGN